MASAKGQTVDLASLSAQQLSQIKKQLDDELEHLTNSFSQLKAAQAKFRECLKSIDGGVNSTITSKLNVRDIFKCFPALTAAIVTLENQILVPLTSSLYVPGTLADADNVIVDVGTGFYVEKSTSDAGKFYENKVEELGTSLKDLEAIVQGKSNNLRIVEDVLRQKVLSSNSTS